MKIFTVTAYSLYRGDYSHIDFPPVHRNVLSHLKNPIYANDVGTPKSRTQDVLMISRAQVSMFSLT